MAQHNDNYIRSALTSLFPAKRIRKLARECGAVQRNRKVDPKPRVNEFNYLRPRSDGFRRRPPPLTPIAAAANYTSPTRESGKTFIRKRQP
jgi:hypothetical protein